MKEIIKINQDYFKREAIRTGDMATHDRITAARQMLLKRCSLRIICSSQSEVSIYR